ncbi:MAG: hypothetical protein BEV12_24240 [Microcystis aeruginosa CACIAM 03]|nr:MAG: hypothetical protein BEV12_24240 [Microcystis aeruginosa CACIAM 03]
MTPYRVCDLSDEAIVNEIVEEFKSKVDVVVGGPPCQGFSTLGKRRDGDKRSTLVEVFADAARAIQPKIIIMENVVGIRSKKHPTYGTYLEAFTQKLQSPKNGLKSYTVSFREINCLDFGLAQTRKRIIAVAFREDIGCPESTSDVFWRTLENERRPAKILREVIGDLPNAPIGSGSGVDINSHYSMRHSKELIARLIHVPPGGGLLDVPVALLTPHLLRMRSGAYGSGGHVKNVYGRLEWDKPCGTIVAGIDKITCGRYIHPEEHRLLTPRECARLQSFPDSFAFSGSMVTKYYLIGNAVPPAISCAIERASRSVLLDGEEINELNAA